MKIGLNLETNEDVQMDLNTLIDTRCLISANSRGGKSYLLRKILEESHGKIQQIVIDLEGEFYTLREKYDYLLIGKQGEIPCNIKTAELLARKLLELNVSTIIDLSDLKKHERIIFVQRFIDSMIDSPKELWHPCLLLVDEAHQFASEHTKSESSSSIIDLMTRGGKRGFVGILATQRISKLSKDACAEANNRLIGRTFLDIDRKRSSEELGFSNKEQERALRDLKPGEFYAFGPAITDKGIIKIKVGEVKTRHIKIHGKELVKPTPTPENIKKLMKNIIDLPKEAEKTLKDLKDYQNEVARLKSELGRRPKEQIIKEVIKPDNRLIERAYLDGSKEVRNELMKEINFLRKENDNLIGLMQRIGKLLDVKPVPRPKYEQKELSKLHTPIPQRVTHVIHESKQVLVNSNTSIDKCGRTIYSLLFTNPERGFTKTQIGLLTGYSPTSGGFSNALAQLNSSRLIRKEGNEIFAGELDSSISTEEKMEFTRENLLRKLGKCPREIIDVLIDSNEVLSKEEIAERTPSNYSVTSGGFSNALAKLNALNMIIRSGNKIKLNPEVLEI